MYSFSLQGVSINLGYNYYVIEVLVYSLLNVNCNDINWLNVKILTYYSLISALDTPPSFAIMQLLLKNICLIFRLSCKGGMIGVLRLCRYFEI